MKVLLVALNSKYIHTPLALWYMKSTLDSCKGVTAEIIDRSINEDIDMIISDILSRSPQIVCFSIYIWNVEHVRKMIKIIKTIYPDIKIVLGGPEVSYDIDEDDILAVYSDYIIKGEGESALKEYILEGKISTSYNIVEDLDKLRSPYTKEMLETAENKIIYFESSRGCPFNCTYCLSSTTKSVRYFSLARVKHDLKKILSYDVKIIKFADRTFNLQKERVKEIVAFFLKNPSRAKIHFEIVADILDDETIELFNNSPKGMFLLEIGIQSTKQETLKEIDRNDDVSKIKLNTLKLINKGRVHLHLDLIAGLPYEKLADFAVTLNDACAMSAHEIQIGFLKFLKGTKILKNALDHNYVYRDYPPYEIIQNKYISYLEINELKKLESVFNRIYNSKLFIETVRELMKHSKGDAYSLFSKMTRSFEKAGFFIRSISLKELSSMLYDFGLSENIDLKEKIVYDHLSTNRGFNLDERFISKSNIKKEVIDKLMTKEEIPSIFPEKNIQWIMKHISFYPFSEGPRIFIHEIKDPITGYYKSIRI